MATKLSDHPFFVILGALAALAGIWVVITEPVYKKIIGGICGSTETPEITQPNQYNSCPNPNKITHYEYTESVTKSSGWVGGGNDQSWHCANVMREKESAVGQSIVWGTATSFEEDRKDFFGKAEYKYHCTIQAQWSPVYMIERWEGCGPADPVTVTVSTPNECYDETQKIGWKWVWE